MQNRKILLSSGHTIVRNVRRLNHVFDMLNSAREVLSVLGMIERVHEFEEGVGLVVEGLAFLEEFGLWVVDGAVGELDEGGGGHG